jgi:hypothetical protein
MSLGAFYRGPSLSTLHVSYAKRGTIDRRAPIKTSRSVLIDAPAADVWELLSNPAAWNRIDAKIVMLSMSGPVAPDTAFTWKNGSARIRSRFAVVEVDREISWTGTSFGARAVHRHVLESMDEGTTSLISEESMAGILLPLFFSAGKLDRALEQWLSAVKQAVEARVAVPLRG